MCGVSVCVCMCVCAYEVLACRCFIFDRLLIAWFESVVPMVVVGIGFVSRMIT